ncbi:MAG: DUF3524 domain-containing protein, partial [Spirochaetaceae bacterium]
MRILFVESFYGGSHREVADSIREHSRNEIDLVTLSAERWKWRIRAAALELADSVCIDGYDLVVCTGLLRVADLLLSTRRPPSGRIPPILLYCHETQLCYPVPEGRRMEVDLGIADIANMLCADSVAFNSCSHRQTFLSEAPQFIERVHGSALSHAMEAIAGKSVVCEPGIAPRAWPAVTTGEAATAGEALTKGQAAATDPPIILWNHRWEFDKNPVAFFDALRAVRARGVRFRVAIAGEHSQRIPAAFEAARAEFGDAIVHYGYAESRELYYSLLDEAAIVVSTAIQENFGIAVMEAIAAGCAPILPDRL